MMTEKCKGNDTNKNNGIGWLLCGTNSLAGATDYWKLSVALW